MSIPDDWIATNVGNSAAFLTGFPFASTKFSQAGVRLIRGSNVKRGVLDWSAEITKYWPINDSSLRAFILREGDIVIAMDGALVGRSFARITSTDLPSFLVQRVARLRGTMVDQNLLYQWIGSHAFARHVDDRKTHTAIPHISPNDIRDFPILIPSSSAEQRRIAEALSDADDLIATLEKTKAKKQAIKQGLMQQLLTGKTRLPGFTKTWSSTTLGALASISRGASPRPIASSRWFDSNSDVRWVRIADVSRSDGRTLRVTTQALSPDGIARSRFLKAGTLIMSIAATVGIPVITGVPTCIHDGFVALENLKADQRFLLYLLKASEATLREAGQSGSQMNVNTDIVRGLAVRLPDDRNEQERIAEVLWDLDDQIFTLERRIVKNWTIKQGMLQQLLTGRTRLPAKGE
ncbi:hypothetical protein GQF42_34960 [Streptomyces broussonetiae]|uniref:Type I restriction modification DNA specificity domain-containing protein n=1 Tax=Streptomyces broussonetiae TaxID=2686304 RepID=A0A6I6NBN2_9ACTN|nr:restriction endonuclease subunit S [Streptomyces broussonetiae]QHA07811.1 hypothetical protein GQF42_34960 [Streptomyces broussonetiae]